MNLNVGDIVEFKNYEDIDVDERVMVAKDFFPSYGKVEEINVNGLDEFFSIVGSQLIFSKKSVAKVIDDVNDDDVDDFKPGEEVWVKTTVNSYYKNTVFLNPIERFVNKDSLKKVKHETPERFIVQEDHYGMYLGMERKLVSDKSKAKIFDSRNEANEVAAGMHLNAWEVIPYGN